MFQPILLAVALRRWATVSPYARAARVAAVALAEGAGAKRELACLSKLLRKAVEWHYLKINPMAGVKPLEEPPGRLRYLEPEEIDTLYGAVEDLASWLKPIVQVALLTGMRRNEILTLRWNHVNLRDAMVILPQTKNHGLRESVEQLSVAYRPRDHVVTSASY
jgi:integrase